jgi:hypothetical protein
VPRGLSITQQLVLRELARGNQLSMQRRGARGTLYARWKQAPIFASVTVRRPTLRALISVGYVTTKHDAGLFLPGQAFAITAVGKQAISKEPYLARLRRRLATKNRFLARDHSKRHFVRRLFKLRGLRITCSCR